MRLDRRTVALPALGLASAGLLVAALVRFADPRASPGIAWTLYLGGLATLLLAFLPWRGHAQVERPISRKEWLGLALALALGAAFRLHHITTTPYGVWFDEAQNALEAQRILSEPGYRPVFVAGWSQMPALAFYYYVPFLKLLGTDVLSLRLATTLVGLAAILAAWWLGRELFGPWEGLLAAGFLALLRWHVGFSRFAVAQIFVTLVPALVLGLFFRSQRRESPRTAVLCGLALGIGLQLYYAVSALPVVLALTFLCGALCGTYRARVGAGLLALTLGVAACADAPVLQYAFQHRDEYGKRFKDTSIVKVGSLAELASVLVEPSLRRGEAWAAVGRNALKHARMFHLQGDSNGRHNLPGAPMLDPVSGLFFGLGLLWCLARPLEARRAALLLWLGAMLAAGVLSVEFEAPQGARTLGATTVVALMAGVALARLRAVLDRTGGAGLGSGAAALLLGIAAVSSWRTYFDRQAWDPAAWSAWSTIETKVAQVVRDEGGGRDVYVPAEFLGGPTETLILGHALEARSFQRGPDLPLEPSGRDALVFFAGHEIETARLLRRYYPAAGLQPFGPPRPDGSAGDPILWIARVPAPQIAALAGWLIELDGDAKAAKPTQASIWHWDEAPAHPPFEARVRGMLRVSRDGPYELVVASDAEASLRVDGEPLLDGKGRQRVGLLLARGNHDVVLDVRVRRPGSETALRWVAPGSSDERPIPAGRMYSPLLPRGGLLGSYYPDPGWSGEPALRQIDPQVAFYFHALPLARPFSVRWSGGVYAPTGGSYLFSTSSVDASWVSVEGHVVVENRLSNARVDGSVVLQEGWHPIEVRYQAQHDYSQVYLYWIPPGGERELVPQEALRPPGPRGGVQSAERVPELARALPPAAAGEVALLRSRELGTEGGLRLAGAPDGRLLVLVPERRRVESFSATDLAPGPALPLGAASRDPSDVATGPDGSVYVLDSAGAVHVFAPGHTLERNIDLRPLAVYNPRGLAVTRRGELLLADTGGGRVLVCDSTGRLLRQVGRLGNGRGELVDPMDVAEDGGGNLVVVDAGNGRIERFAPDGSAVAVWPRAGARASLGSPRLDTDAAGAVWVAGGESAEIWRLDPTGSLTVFRAPAGLRVVGLSAGTTGRLFLVAQAPGRLLEAHVP
jgi:hypothetical protein